MASSEVLFFCPCLSTLPAHPPPSIAPLSTLVHHPLPSLYFCEECDTPRCLSCVAVEVAAYYCPSCLFEVPSASVRGERNRCGRNCFTCPGTGCGANLQVVSDGKEGSKYWLSCTACRWNSRDVKGWSFDKPTGLTQQRHKLVPPASEPASQEFDQLKNHFSSLLSSAPALSPSSQLLGSHKFPSSYGLSGLSRRRDTREKERDELLPAYEALFPSSMGSDDTDAQLEELRTMTSLDLVAPVEARWSSPFSAPIGAEAQEPQRTLLHPKLALRCPSCAHILLKPDSKSSSTRYKIKLLAANYLPSILLARKAPAGLGSSRLSASAAAQKTKGAGAKEVAQEPLRPGRTYSFEIEFSNPLYEAISVRLAVARPPAIEGSIAPAAAAAGATEEAAATEDGKKSSKGIAPFAVHLPASSFPISAFAEAWEYDDLLSSAHDAPTEHAGRKGVERRGNRTTVGLEVAVARETPAGPITASMLVTYTYASDTSSPSSPKHSKSKSRSAASEDTTGADEEGSKTFSFWVLLPLGTVQPRPAGAVGEGSRLAGRRSVMGLSSSVLGTSSSAASSGTSTPAPVAE